MTRRTTRAWLKWWCGKGERAMNGELLADLARHQAWADAAHWKALRENAALLEDAEIRARLNHMLMTLKMLATLARGQTPDAAGMKEIDSIDELEASMGRAHGELAATLDRKSTRLNSS